MAAHLSTDSIITNNELRTFYDAVLIKSAKARLLHNQFGRKVNVPLHYGPTISFRKFADMATTTTALTEGTAGTETAFSITSVTTSLPEYGRPA